MTLAFPIAVKYITLQMKLTVTLLPVYDEIDLPINLNSAIRAVIQAVIDEKPRFCSHPEQVLNDQPDHEFTFSQLHIPSRRIFNNRIKARKSPLTLYISSPDTRLIRCMMHGFMETGVLRLAGEKMKILKAEVEDIEMQTTTLRATCLSPFVVQRPQPDTHLQFALPHEYDLPAFLGRTMSERYHNYYPDDALESEALSIYFDPAYVLRRQGKITKLITVDIPGYPTPIKIKGIQAPVILEGSPHILKFALEAGLGSFTGFGFGMLQPTPDHSAG